MDSAFQPTQLLTRGAVASTLADLVRIDSRNPAHGGPQGGEAAAMRCAAAFLNFCHVESELWDALPGRPNVTARIPGLDASRTLLFETHVDTVSTCGMTIAPFGAEEREGRLWGRGSTDAKGQVACMLHAFGALASEKIRPAMNIELVLVSDEEAGFGGVNALVRRLKEERRLGEIAGAVVGEPTGLEIVTVHKGSIRWWLKCRGRAAHSSQPERGINAIRHAAALTELIEGRYAVELKQKSHPLVGSPTINVSMTEGGTAVNLVPELARILLDRRTIPGETWETVRNEMDLIIVEVRRKFPEADITQEEPLMVDPCLETTGDHPLLRRALALAANAGRCADPIGVPYCTDASKFSEAGIPTIVAGPGSIDQAHTADEWIDLDELERGARFYFELMKSDGLS